MPQSPPLELATAEVSRSPRRLWQRRKFWVWTFVGVVACFVSVVLLLPSSRTFFQFLRVKKGMSPSDVVALLGPPNVRSGGQTAEFDDLRSGHMVWLAGEMTLFVQFHEGAAVHK